MKKAKENKVDVIMDLSLPYKVADMSGGLGQAQNGISRKRNAGAYGGTGKIRRGETPERPKIMGSLHMTIQTAMLIETLKSSGRISAGRPAISFPRRTMLLRPLPRREPPPYLPGKAKPSRNTGGARNRP